MTSWSTTLREAIAASGQTHYALAKLTGLPATTIDRIAAGASPNLATAEKLGKVLGLRLLWNKNYGKSLSSRLSKSER